MNYNQYSLPVLVFFGEILPLLEKNVGLLPLLPGTIGCNEGTEDCNIGLLPILLGCAPIQRLHITRSGYNSQTKTMIG